MATLSGAADAWPLSPGAPADPARDRRGRGVHSCPRGRPLPESPSWVQTPWSTWRPAFSPASHRPWDARFHTDPHAALQAWLLHDTQSHQAPPPERKPGSGGPGLPPAPEDTATSERASVAPTGPLHIWAETRACPTPCSAQAPTRGQRPKAQCRGPESRFRWTMGPASPRPPRPSTHSKQSCGEHGASPGWPRAHGTAQQPRRGHPIVEGAGKPDFCRLARCAVPLGIHLLG